MKKKTIATVEIGSGNVFKDLGFPHPEEMQAKAALASELLSIIQKHKWKQTEAAEALGLPQSKVSLLTRGQLSGFSIERLMRLLNKLNRDINIVVRDRVRSRQQIGHISVSHAAA